MKHIDAHALFNPNQHGFRQGVSCVTQLTEFVHQISEKLDQRRCIDCVFIDFKKAFDVVDHNLLIRKLHRFNINPRIVE